MGYLREFITLSVVASWRRCSLRSLGLVPESRHELAGYDDVVDDVTMTTVFGGEQKDEKSKLMKEYAKQNKDSDMSLASTKKKEDFGGMLPAFQFSHASCKTLCSLSALLRCHAVAWAMCGLTTNCIAFRCLLLFPS